MAAKKQKLFYGLFEDGIRDLGKSRHLCVRPVAFWAWLCVSATRNQKCFPASAFPLPHTSVRCRHLRHRHAEVVSRVLMGTHGEVKGDPNTHTEVESRVLMGTHGEVKGDQTHRHTEVVSRVLTGTHGEIKGYQTQSTYCPKRFCTFLVGSII